MTGISRATIREWRNYQGRARPRQLVFVFGHGSAIRRAECPSDSPCPRCDVTAFDERAYAYLLGLYLGDGYIATHPRTYRLRIALDFSYPGIIGECAAAIDRIKTGGARASLVPSVGCAEVTSYWAHWPCLFPQHGRGPKFLRRIALEQWQQEIADRYPDCLLRGLIHSDGCRYANTVNGKAYWSYAFSNNSRDIQGIFTSACDRMGIRWRRASWKMISVTRRADVEKLDVFIGPKA